MSSDPVDDAEGYEEGIEAFNRMTDAMQALQSHLDALDTSLGGKVAQAEQTASKAETAAANARQAAEHAAASARAGALSAASWATLGAVAGLLAAGGAGYWLGHASGQENGLAEGYRAALDEKAAASWANTPNGQLAFAMDRAGSLDLVARCNGQGWTPTVQNGRKVCYPNASAGKAVDGWYLP
jgi:hypothetical protein